MTNTDQPTGPQPGDENGQGRLFQYDARNLDHALPLVEVPKTVRRRMWWGGAVLDQGNTPHCVGYAGFGWLAGGPVVNKPDFTPVDLYHWAQDHDEWPGHDYEGTSTLGLMKALRDKGYIWSYEWAFDAETLVAWLLTTGPVLVGTSWFEHMANPHADGFMQPTGDDFGGHEYRIVGADRDKVAPDGTVGAVRMINSYGRSWGDDGRGWISFPDLDKLIKRDGEAVTATEIKRVS